METPCTKCGQREAEYDAPGVWCEICWVDWWCEGIYRKDWSRRERARYRRELQNDLRRWKKEDRRKEKRSTGQ